MEEVIEDIINMESSFNDEGIGCSETPLLMQRTVSILWNLVFIFIIQKFTELFNCTLHLSGQSSVISGIFSFLLSYLSFCQEVLQEKISVWWRQRCSKSSGQLLEYVENLWFQPSISSGVQLQFTCYTMNTQILCTLKGLRKLCLKALLPCLKNK